MSSRRNSVLKSHSLPDTSRGEVALSVLRSAVPNPNPSERTEQSAKSVRAGTPKEEQQIREDPISVPVLRPQAGVLEDGVGSTKHLEPFEIFGKKSYLNSVLKPTLFQILRGEVARLKGQLSKNRSDSSQQVAALAKEEQQIREENLRLRRKLEMEMERRQELCRHLSESESSLEMEDERHFNELSHQGQVWGFVAACSRSF